MKNTNFYTCFKNLVSVICIIFLVACGGQNQSADPEKNSIQDSTSTSENAVNLDPELLSANASLLDSKLNETTINLSGPQNANTTAQLTPTEVDSLTTIEVSSTADLTPDLNQLITSKSGATISASTTTRLALSGADQIVIKYKEYASASNEKIAQAHLNMNELSKVNQVRAGNFNLLGFSKSLSVLAQKNNLKLSFQGSTHDNAAVFNLGRKLNTAELSQLKSQIKASDPNIDYVAIDSQVFPTAAPNDPNFLSQWNFKSSERWSLDAENAWSKTNGSGVVVAVVDSGFRPHADLAGRLLKGYDFIKNKSNSNDGNGRDSNAIDPGDGYTNSFCGPDLPVTKANSWHGLQMSGIIAANRNNSRYISGIASGVKILPVRVVGRCGGKISDVADGIVWASGGKVAGVPKNNTPAKIINVSLSSYTAEQLCSPLYEQAITKARDNGSIVVVSAGNTGQVKFETPANCENVISVAPSKQNGDPQLEIDGAKIYAPGDNILTLSNTGDSKVGKDNGLVVSSGSSIASAQYSGMLALILSYRPRFADSELKEVIHFYSRRLENCADYRCNIVDLNEFMELANSTNYRAKDDFKGNGKSGILLELTSLSQKKLTMGFVEKNAIQLPYVKDNVSAKAIFQSGDFDGDGRADVLQSSSNFLENYYRLKPGSKGGLGTEVALQSEDFNPKPDFIGGFSADGKDSFAFYEPAQNRIRFARVNSLGKWRYLFLDIEPNIEPITTMSNTMFSIPGGYFNLISGESTLIFRNKLTSDYIYSHHFPLGSMIFQLRSNEKIVGSGNFIKTGTSQLLVLDTTSNQLYLTNLKIAHPDGITVSYKPLIKLPSQIELVNIGDYNGNGQDDFLVRNKVSKAISLVSFTNNSFKVAALRKLPAGYEFGYSSGVRKF
jgi:serine protease